MADNLEQLYGDYNPTVEPKFAKTPLQGLKTIANQVFYGAGCTDNKCTDYTKSNVTSAVQAGDMVVVCLGTGIETNFLQPWRATDTS